MVAGGNWRIIEEIVDSEAVRQQDSLSCGAACGEILLKSKGITNITQSRIVRESYKMEQGEFFCYWTLRGVFWIEQ